MPHNEERILSPELVAAIKHIQAMLYELDLVASPDETTAPQIPYKVLIPALNTEGRSLADKQFGRGLAIFENAGLEDDDPNRFCRMWQNPDEPDYIWVATNDPKRGETMHRITAPALAQWKVEGWRRLSGNTFHPCVPYFEKWCDLSALPEWLDEAKSVPGNLVAVNVNMARIGAGLRVALPNDNKVLYAAALARGTQFRLYRDETGAIHPKCWEKIAEGYLQEQRSWVEAGPTRTRNPLPANPEALAVA